MKSLLIAMTVVLSGASVFADIPVKGGAVKTFVYGGDKAEAKFTSIKSDKIDGNSSGWSGESQTYKVERAADNLSQTVCTMNFNYRDSSKPATYQCAETRSTNGQPVPAFRAPPRRLG